MARRIAIPFRDMALKVVGPLGGYLAARIQRLDIPVNFPSTNINELGNQRLAGITTDIPEVSTTFQAMDVSIKLFSALTGSTAADWAAGGIDINQLGEFDAIGVVKDANISDFVKSIHLRKCVITGFTYSYSVDAEATEEYTASGNEKRWFKYDVIVDEYAAGVGSPQVLSQTPILLKNGNYALSVVLDGTYLDEVNVAPATGEYRIVGLNLSFADAVVTRLVAVYHANPAGNNWTGVLDTTIPAAIRGKNIPVTIGVHNIERVQSVTIRGTFPNEVIKEMGNTSVVGTIVQIPEVTGDISVLDTDMELIALFTTGLLNPSGVTEFRDCEFTASGLSLEVKLHEPASGCGNTGPVLKTVYIPGITITSEGHTTNVGGNATQTFAYKSTDSQCLVYSGSR